MIPVHRTRCRSDATQTRDSTDKVSAMRATARQSATIRNGDALVQITWGTLHGLNRTV